MTFYDIIYLKFKWNFGKDDSFGRHGFRMAFRDRCGDRRGSLNGFSGIDMVRTVCLYFYDPGALRGQIVDTVDRIFCRFPFADDMLEACFQEKYGTQNRTYQCGYADRYAGCRG